MYLRDSASLAGHMGAGVNILSEQVLRRTENSMIMHCNCLCSLQANCRADYEPIVVPAQSKEIAGYFSQTMGAARAAIHKVVHTC